MSCDDIDYCIRSGEDLIIAWEQTDAAGVAEPAAGDLFTMSIRLKDAPSNAFQFDSNSALDSNITFTDAVALVSATYSGSDTTALAPGVYSFSVFYRRNGNPGGEYLFTGSIVVEQGLFE